jgi:hypothetical protein
MSNRREGIAHDIEGRCDVIGCDKPSGVEVDNDGEEYKICGLHAKHGWGFVVPDKPKPKAREGPPFQEFADALREEARWSASIHAGDKTGQAWSDQDSLERLARRVEELGRTLGFLS